MNTMPRDGLLWTIRHKQQVGRNRTVEKESRIIKAAKEKTKEKGFNPQMILWAKERILPRFLDAQEGRDFPKEESKGKARLSADAEDGASAAPVADSTTWQGQSEEPYQEFWDTSRTHCWYTEDGGNWGQ